MNTHGSSGAPEQGSRLSYAQFRYEANTLTGESIVWFESINALMKCAKILVSIDKAYCISLFDLDCSILTDLDS